MPLRPSPASAWLAAPGRFPAAPPPIAWSASARHGSRADRGRGPRAAADIEAAQAERWPDPMFRDFADEFMCRQARQWKPATRRSNAAALRRDLLPVFGAMRLADSARANVQRWFDSMNGAPRTANRALPVLSVMMTPAELWDVRPQGSNPCRNMRRHRMKPRERFLALNEQKRLRFVLDHAEGRHIRLAPTPAVQGHGSRWIELEVRWRRRNFCAGLPRSCPASVASCETKDPLVRLLNCRTDCSACSGADAERGLDRLDRKERRGAFLGLASCSRRFLSSASNPSQ